MQDNSTDGAHDLEPVLFSGNPPFVMLAQQLKHCFEISCFLRGNKLKTALEL